MRVSRIVADLAVADLESAEGIYTGFLGLGTEALSLATASGAVSLARRALTTRLRHHRPR